jgi:hypothetical protein
VPVVVPLFMPVVLPVPAVPAVLVDEPAAAVPGAAVPLVPPLAPPPAPPPAPCARAMDEVTARIEAKTIVVNFICFFRCWELLNGDVLPIVPRNSSAPRSHAYGTCQRWWHGSTGCSENPPKTRARKPKKNAVWCLRKSVCRDHLFSEHSRKAGGRLYGTFRRRIPWAAIRLFLRRFTGKLFAMPSQNTGKLGRTAARSDRFGACYETQASF